MALLQIRGVSKTFRTLRALDGVDIDVEAGTFHGLIGPNGSGKSTLLKAIAGAHFADTGTIVFDGHDITRATPYERARAGLSLKFQITAVLPELSVYDNVAMIHEHSGAKRASRRADVLGAIGFVGLETPPQTKVGGLGARERRLVEVARAVVGKPRVVLLDEPAAGLPDEETAQLADVIKKIPEHMGALVILVDHDMTLVSACCETTAVLDFGRLIASGPTADVLRNEHVMRAYLGTEAEI